MKILEQNSGLLSNFEVCQVLNQRGCEGLVQKALASEKMVYQYLKQRTHTSLSEKQLQDFIQAVQPYQLTRVEVLQLLNLVPATAVEVHLVVEECEERLGEDKVEELLQLVSKHIPRPQPQAEQA
mmetsp:Transcript_27410/g.59962  ORF Transcript_27410/g.59962 Transcript_27410/m.59962 type:complete len:125 (+) Transcript_27410:168-542(+)|eukprot:CAMPEP_0202891758 /NCGR_PEP_ID=MMETSP1392-20130828/1743_1 /ASSEMBLY_ACC=CAM_ASM_000868 /TAXON_ID=225041 /ORGANISM="Chlamydomonas chlamydogama, Strain SAG 11-48b" /LENGTH=124 /DNA_ID=CAMNT_0049575611 /DNA_START=137 /DNA_END=511 /DNA_ORIENTATION=+